MKLHENHLDKNQDRRQYYMEVAKSVDNGAYFKEGMNWYKEICLLPVCERSYLIILTSVACFILATTILNTQMVSGKLDEIPLIVDVEENSDLSYYPHKLSKDLKESPQLSIANFMIRTYVTSMESYSPDFLENENMVTHLRKIKTSSSKNIFNQYRSYMSTLNRNSPVKLMSDHTGRDVEIYGIQYNKDYLFNAHATVTFRVRQYPITDDSQLEKEVFSNWQADIHFRLSDIETIARSEAPIKFQVTSYTTRELYSDQ